jgi:hypothetical protein
MLAAARSTFFHVCVWAPARSGSYCHTFRDEVPPGHQQFIDLARARDVALQIHVCDFLLQCRAAGSGDGICCSHRKKARENRDPYSSQNNGQCGRY